MIAKAGIITMTKYVALQYGKEIHPYALAIDYVLTDAKFDSMTRIEKNKAITSNSMKKFGTSSEVANITAIIADNIFSFETGDMIIIDSGAVLG